MNVVLGGKPDEAITGDDQSGYLPLLLFPIEQIRLFVALLEILRLAQKVVRKALDPAGLEIQKRREFVHLHFQRINDILQEQRRRHRSRISYCAGFLRPTKRDRGVGPRGEGARPVGHLVIRSRGE